MAHIFSGRKSAEEIVSVCLPFTKEVQIVYTVKSRAVDRSTIQFLSIFGVLLTEICY